MSCDEKVTAAPEGAISVMSSSTTNGDSVAGLERAELAIDGMHCESCAALIEETLGGEAGVVEIHVDLARATAAITFDPDHMSIDRVNALVAELGYRATRATEGEHPGV